MAMAITSPHLPFDLVEQVLCRLPVKHLIQLCCVCKSWNTLISDDSKFAKKHLRLSTSSNDRHHHIQAIAHSSPLREILLLLSPISSIFNSTSTVTAAQSRYFLRDIIYERSYSNRASTCDGIICFKIDDSHSRALLCNPSIRKSKKLPPLKLPDQTSDYITYTLVYDRFTNNYKVIAINAKEVNVHTLGTDYWRRIQDFPAFLYMLIPGIFVNYSVNWLAYADASFARFIVSFDLEKESFQMLSLPVNDVQFKTSFILGTLRGCLSLLFNSSDKFCDVWIMKEYGNEKSWTKLLTLPHMKECGFYGYTKALYISKDDQVLMECSKRGEYSLVVYDSINNTFKIPKFQNTKVEGDVKSFTLGVYVESLISPL